MQRKATRDPLPFYQMSSGFAGQMTNPSRCLHGVRKIFSLEPKGHVDQTQKRSRKDGLFISPFSGISSFSSAAKEFWKQPRSLLFPCYLPADCLLPLRNLLASSATGAHPAHRFMPGVADAGPALQIAAIGRLDIHLRQMGNRLAHTQPDHSFFQTYRRSRFQSIQLGKLGGQDHSPVLIYFSPPAALRLCWRDFVINRTQMRISPFKATS